MAQEITICHLYPKEMNIYGDNGNVKVLRKRLERRGIIANVVGVGIGDKLPHQTDILVAGGGQDAGQFEVQSDLQQKKTILHDMAKDGVGMLLVCGMYQLFGHRFIVNEGIDIEGIGVLDIETIAKQQRLIGNINLDTEFGTVVGYENHSGQTFLGSSMKPFGSVLKGEGNNTDDNDEGCMFNNVIGTYLHGPLLPKNPQVADHLLSVALKRKYGAAQLLDLDDSLAIDAKTIALKRPR